MFNALPPELILRILGFLDIQSIHDCQLISPIWNQFVKLNESTIYRAMAIQHNFVSNWHSSLEDVRTELPGPWMASVSTWKDLCQRFFMLDRNWHARGERAGPRERLYRSSRGVHRFKLEEKHRLIIATFPRGGLRVFCMDTDELLFELPNTYVKRSAHCEYDNGYLTFDRHGVMEVWKFAFAPESSAEAASESPPDERQIKAYEDAVQSYPSPDGRGILRPHALLRPPRSCRAFRFVYPTLLVGSSSGQRGFLYDIPTGSLEETIPFPVQKTLHTVPNDDNLPIHYVEIGPQHIFICSRDDIVILARNHEKVPLDRRVLRFPSSEKSLVYKLPGLAKTRAYRVGLTNCQSTRGIGERALSPLVQTDSTSLVSFREAHHNFCAVHVSPTGKSFAAITWTGLLFLVRDFERVLPGADGSEPEKSLGDGDVTLAIDMQSPLTNLTFGEDGQVVVHSFTAFHIVLWPESAPSAPRTYPSSLTASHRSNLPPAFSDVRLFNLTDFTESNALPLITCLKVSRTAIWFDWSARALSDHKFQVWQEHRTSIEQVTRQQLGDSAYAWIPEGECGLEAGEREEDIRELYQQDVIDENDPDNDDDDDDAEDAVWMGRSAYAKRTLCRVDFSPRCFS